MRGRRHKHNLGSARLTTCDMGENIPIGLTEVLPGDTFEHSTSVLIRLSPMVAPVMHKMVARVHHFFVAHRLIWEEAGGTGTFEDFMTGGGDGNDAQQVPVIEPDPTKNFLADYYGIPLVPGLTVSALPFAGYNKVHNEYYRDQDIEVEVSPDNQGVRKVAWEKDYLTTARPWPQKGEDVTLPLGDKAPVLGIGKVDQAWVGGSSNLWESDGNQRLYADYQQIDPAAAASQFRVERDPAGDTPNIFADLSAATASNVNQIRLAFALQRFQEARARYGSRYTEYLRYLGITPSDARLDRPEYLGGGRVRVSVSEVLQTAPPTAEGPTPEYGIGDMYGHGIAAVRSNAYRRFFEEHGYVHTFLSLRPEPIYMDGIDRTWLRRFREDFFQRELQHIGQQEIWQNEVFAEAENSYADVFGYQDRYREYREQNSEITGEFRELLDYWHLGRKFDTAPALNGAFVRCTPSKRIFQEQTNHSMWVRAQHKLIARRIISRNAAGRIL